MAAARASASVAMRASHGRRTTWAIVRSTVGRVPVCVHEAPGADAGRGIADPPIMDALRAPGADLLRRDPVDSLLYRARVGGLSRRAGG